MPTRVTQEEFIVRAIKVHGDKYDWIYILSNAK